MEEEEILNTEWDWVLTLPEGEYVPPQFIFPSSGSTIN